MIVVSLSADIGQCGGWAATDKGECVFMCVCAEKREQFSSVKHPYLRAHPSQQCYKSHKTLNWSDAFDQSRSALLSSAPLLLF